MVKSALGGLFAAMQVLLGLILIAAVLLNFANVIARYLFGVSILWADEVEMFGLVFITFIGAAIVGWHRAHLTMDMLRNRMSAPVRAALVVVETAVLVMIAALLCWQSYVYSSQMFLLGRASDNAGIPMWIPHSTVAIGFALLAIVALWQVYALLRGIPPPRSAMLDEPSEASTDRGTP
jgi:TRAP-type C4-dicarboxylate transport system permease small subunit